MSLARVRQRGYQFYELSVGDQFVDIESEEVLTKTDDDSAKTEDGFIRYFNAVDKVVPLAD